MVGGLKAVVAVGRLSLGADELRVDVGVGGDGQERVVGAVQGDHGLADAARERHAGDGPVDALRTCGVVVVGLLSRVGGVEFRAVDALGELPIDLVVERPEELRAGGEARVQERLVGGRVSGGRVRRVGPQNPREVGEQVGAVGAPERAFRVDAAVEQLRAVLQLPADEVSAVGDARRIRAAGRAPVPFRDDLLGGPRELRHPVVPFGDGVAGAAAVLEELGAAVALVRRGVGVALGERPVGDREVVGVLPPVAGRAGDHETAVPALGQADDELGVVVPAVVGVERRGVGEVAVQLDAPDPGRVARPGGVQPGPVGRDGVARADRPRGREVVEAGGHLLLRPRHREPGRAGGVLPRVGLHGQGTARAAVRAPARVPAARAGRTMGIPAPRGGRQMPAMVSAGCDRCHVARTHIGSPGHVPVVVTCA